MSSSTLAAIETQLTLYEYPICMILGNIGNAFIVIIFNRQRQTACSMYLIIAAVVNMIYLTYNSIASIFTFYYPNSTSHAIIFCKINTYILNFIGQASKTFLILACIDRFLITSNRANFRAFSTPKRAKYIIFFSFIFWSLFVIHVPIMVTVINGQCAKFGVYTTIYSVYSIIFVGLIPIIILGIFGYLTYHNMRQLQIRVQPVVRNTMNESISIQRRDRDLLIIVIAEVITYVVTTALFPLIQLEMMITQYVMPNKSFQYLQIEIIILNIAYFLLSVNCAASFYVYLMSSKSFRRDFKQLTINSYRKFRRQQPVVEIAPRDDRTLTQRDTHV